MFLIIASHSSSHLHEWPFAASQQYCEVGTISSIFQTKLWPLNNSPKVIQLFSGKPAFYHIDCRIQALVTVLYYFTHHGSSQLWSCCWGWNSSFIYQIFLLFSPVFHTPRKYFRDIPKSPHIFSWTTNPLTLLQYFCHVCVFCLYLPFIQASA